MKTIFLFSLLLITIFFLMCASQGFPPGGPLDQSPPFILNTFPAADTTHVPLDVQIEIEFSEAVNPHSCQDVLFITPFPGEDITYKWKRDQRLTIIFGDSLLPDRTYIVTIGAGTKDRRNNTMKSSYTLAFSTGDVLDEGLVQGRVYGEAAGTQIWAYDLADTTQPNPAEEFPLYITQAGKDGIYRLTNMALSDYRMLAILDRDVNNKYNVGYDMLGVATRDISLDSTDFSVENFNFRITIQDTTRPMLNSAFTPDNQHVDVRFTESMLPDCLAVVSNYTIENEGDLLNILNASIDINNAAMVHLTTSRQDSGKEYTISAKDGFDMNYLPILPDSNFAVFAGSAIPDTTRPTYVTMQPHDSSKMIMSFTPLHFHFSKAMSPASIEHLVVADTLGDTIKGEITWPEKSHYIFTPTEKFAKERFYLVTLPVDSVFDMAGNPLADTLFQRQFTSLNPDTLTAISGHVTDEDTTATGPFFLRAKSAIEKDERQYELWINEPGPFQFEEMIPGIYTIELYRDKDENGRFSYGDAFPFTPAERFWVYPDTIEIRARWPNEGEKILLPK